MGSDGKMASKCSNNGHVTDAMDRQRGDTDINMFRRAVVDSIPLVCSLDIIKAAFALNSSKPVSVQYRSLIMIDHVQGAQTS